MDFVCRQTHCVAALTSLRRSHFSCRFRRSPFCWQFPRRSRRPSMVPIRLIALGSWRLAAYPVTGGFFAFVTSHVTHWLGSSVVRQWLWIMTVGSFGTILLRPYYLVIGLPTTGAAWLMHRNDLLTPQRFFSTEALLWCVTLVGFASIVRVSMSGEKWSRTVMLTTSIVIAALSASAQLALVP